eukprot:COSAG02_NODE_254_length_26937_cov_16.503950_30_plen_491_part_00
MVDFFFLLSLTTSSTSGTMSINISTSTLADLVAQYSVKTRPGNTSTNNTVPQSVSTVLSSVKTAYRRIHGNDPPGGDLGDLTWLTPAKIEGANLSIKDRPLFANQQNTGTNIPLEGATVRKTFENYKSALFAARSYVKTLDLAPGEKKRLRQAYKKAHDGFYDAADSYIKEERDRAKQRLLSKRQEAKNVPWSTIMTAMVTVLQFLETTFDTVGDDDDDEMTPSVNEIRKIQRGVQLAMYTLVPPIRNDYARLRFVRPGTSEEELRSTHSPNFVEIGPDTTRIVINRTKNDGRGQEDDYDPEVDFRFDHENTLKLDLQLPSAPTNADSEDTVKFKMDQANVIHVLEKYGFNPVRLGKILTGYQAWLNVVMGDRNPKQFLFFDPKRGQNAEPLTDDGAKSRLYTITKKLVGKDLGAQMLRPLFLTHLDTQNPTTADREIIADCMLHSVATQMGRYTKKTGPRKRLGDDDLGQTGDGRAKKARAQAPSVPDF